MLRHYKPILSKTSSATLLNSSFFHDRALSVRNIGLPTLAPAGYESEWLTSFVNTYHPLSLAIFLTYCRDRSCSAFSALSLNIMPASSGTGSFLYVARNSLIDLSSSGSPIVDRNSGFTG